MLAYVRSAFFIDTDPNQSLSRTLENSGFVLGDVQFAQEIESLTQQRVSARKVGRPKKESEKPYSAPHKK